MKKRFLQRTLVLGALLGLAGCSSLFGPEGYFRDRGDDYLRADVLPPMQVPASMGTRQLNELYHIPEQGGNDLVATEEFQVPRPQPLVGEVFADKVKIQRLNDKRWILVHAEPAEVWPKLRYYLGQNQIQVVFTDPVNGILETGWIRFKGEASTKDKYRLRIEQGVQPGYTEIHVLHLSAPQGAASGSRVDWPSRSSNPEREAWMLDELAAVLASDESEDTASLLAQTVGVNERVQLANKGAESILTLDLDYVRSQATVAHALQQQGFGIWGQKNNEGIFYVYYDETLAENYEPGFWRKLFGFTRGSAPTTPYTLEQVLARLQVTGSSQDGSIFESAPENVPEALDDVPGYLVVVRTGDGVVEVFVRDGYGKKLPGKQAKKLLTLIRNNLI